MTEKEIQNIKDSSFKKLDIFIEDLKNNLHSDLFKEEYDFVYDSIQDAKDRSNGISPMSQDYTSKVNLKREKLKVSKLGNDGKPIDNSSSMFIDNLVSDYLINKAKSRTKELKKGMNISTFFKNTSN